MRMSFTAHGAVTATNTNALVGVMDLDVVQTSGSTYLFAATRGDGWLTVFDLGANGGDTTEADSIYCPSLSVAPSHHSHTR